MLDALSLQLHLSSSVAIRVQMFGTPRVSDPDFVSFFDSKVGHLLK